MLRIISRKSYRPKKRNHILAYLAPFGLTRFHNAAIVERGVDVAEKSPSHGSEPGVRKRLA